VHSLGTIHSVHPTWAVGGSAVTLPVAGVVAVQLRSSGFGLGGPWPAVTQSVSVFSASPWSGGAVRPGCQFGMFAWSWHCGGSGYQTQSTRMWRLPPESA